MISKLQLFCGSRKKYFYNRIYCFFYCMFCVKLPKTPKPQNPKTPSKAILNLVGIIIKMVWQDYELIDTKRVIKLRYRYSQNLWLNHMFTAVGGWPTLFMAGCSHYVWNNFFFAFADKPAILEPLMSRSGVQARALRFGSFIAPVCAGLFLGTHLFGNPSHFVHLQSNAKAYKQELTAVKKEFFYE